MLKYIVNTNVELTEKLIEITNKLREKYKALRQNQIDFDNKLHYTLKPITKPLNDLLNAYESNKLVDKQFRKLELPKAKRKLEDEYVTFEEPKKLKYTENDEIAAPLSVTPNSSPSHSIYEDEDDITHTKIEGYNDDDESDHTIYDDVNPLYTEYTALHFTPTNALDTTHGVRFENGKWKIGDSTIAFNGDDMEIKNAKYEGTKGLYELLFMKRPDKKLLLDEDKENYKTILFATNALRKNYSASKQKQGNRGIKYRDIIKKFWKSSGKKEGQGLTGNKAYVYWDDPNELVDRLRLLIASKSAGHTGHDKEIASIIKALKDASIIE